MIRSRKARAVMPRRSFSPARKAVWAEPEYCAGAFGQVSEHAHVLHNQSEGAPV